MYGSYSYGEAGYGSNGITSASSTTYTVTGSGGAVVGGTADIVQIGSRIIDMVGGAVAGGAVTIVRTIVVIPSGGAVAGGEADHSNTDYLIVEMSGGAVAGGSATVSTFTVAPSSFISTGIVTVTGNPIYSLFYWPYTVTRVVVTPGYTDQTTKAWVAETTSEKSITTAHVSDITIKELDYLEPGLFNRGDRKIAVFAGTGLVVGDRVKIIENSGGTDISEWIVKSKLNASNLLSKHAGVRRDTFYLKRRP